MRLIKLKRVNKFSIEKVKGMRLALVPAFNEERTIEKVISKLKKLGFEVIVVDDGSTDKTFELAKKAGSIVLRHEENKGKGLALKTGFEYILREFPTASSVIVIDADLQYSPDDAIKVLKPIEEKKADFVMGCRNWREIPFRHRLGNFVWRTLFNLFFNTSLKDTNCGIIALSRETIKKVKKAIHGGYIIENAILAEVVKNKLRIEQVPVEVHYRSKSGLLRGIRVVLGISIFIIIEGLKYRLGKRY